MKKSMVALVLAFVMGIALNSFDAGAQMGSGMMGSGGTSWGKGAFRSNGERIYFTATSERGPEITYTGGPTSTGWMMMGGGWHAFRVTAPMGRVANTTWV